MNEDPIGKLCGRALSAADLERIRAAVREADPPQRAEIARRVCTALNWVDVQGRPKLMSCRVGLLRLHRAGLIALPAPRVVSHPDPQTTGHFCREFSTGDVVFR
ncbi:MAG TPA: hypothetical protein VLQ88_11240 [Chromatiaceae bacterium]|nr:hypothetical protein [Chromatiaceae bacterium]